jgi:hypothetical protein
MLQYAGVMESSDFRMEISDLRAQNLLLSNGFSLNQQSEIINDTDSNTPKALIIFTGKAIES